MKDAQRGQLNHGFYVAELARWWHSASEEARFALLLKAAKGEAKTPSLEAVHLAALLAETEAGTVDQG